MGVITDRLKTRKYLVSDGAWGTMLQERGLKPGDCPEAWNLDRPDDVRAVAAAYVAAGSDIVLANTFGGSCLKLAKYGLADKMADINQAGARLSIEAAQGKALVAASMGPTGEFLEPYGDMTEEEMFAVFREQAAALAAGGARAVCIETMTAIEEACLAVKAAKSADPGLDVICTMTFDPSPAGFKTMMGVGCRRAAEELAAAGADVIGANCGNGMDQMVLALRELAACTNLPLLVHANAGVPELVDGRTVFRDTPEYMASRVQDILSAGARIVGGCCGTTPKHIAAIRAAVDRIASSGARQ